MYTILGTVQIKSGQQMEIGVVRAPDAEWAERLAGFLSHKGPDWVPQVEMALTGSLDSMLSLFFIGLVEGQLACHTVVSGERRVGILGHVYTRPEDRRKGAIKILMEHVLAYCTSCYDVLSLMTGFDTPPYWIYHSLGFRGVTPTSDEMLWQPRETHLPFAPGSTAVRDLEWGDWAFLNLMSFQTDDDYEMPRSPLLGLKGLGHVEASFITLQMRRLADPSIQAKALVSGAGATVGWTLLAPDLHWFGDVLELDLCVHPNFIEDLVSLASSIELPHSKVVSYVTDPAGERARALLQLGFRQETTLKGFLQNDGARDLYVFARL